MLTKKMFRDMKKNWFPFLSIFLLSYLALFMYTGMLCSNIGIRQIRSDYHEKTNLADIWIYGTDITEEELKKVDGVDCVTDSQLRLKLTAESVQGYQIDLYAQEENAITMPYNMGGEDYDENSKQGIWLNSRYAKEHSLDVGDTIDIIWNGIEISQKIKGLIMTPEYEYYKATEDVEVNFSHIAYAYMGYDAVKAILKESMPSYNQILVKANTDEVANVENEIASAISNNYSQMLDRESLTGLTAFDSELTQHDMFAYAFPMIFLLIAILTIITTMGRIISNQRIQIGTMKALGIGKNKIICHYVGFSFVVSVMGCVLGVVTGPIVMGPVFNDFMPESYSMPEWGYGYSPKFYIVAAIVVCVCVFAAYMNCKKLICTNTVEILYARAPKEAKNCVFEKLPFWNTLSFATQYNLRDMARAKLRSVIVVFGVMCGTILMLCAFGCNDTMSSMRSWMFEDLMDYESTIHISTAASKEEYTKLAEKVDGELVMSSNIEVRLNGGENNAKTGLTVSSASRLYKVTDRNKKVCAVKDGQVLITQNFAQKWDIEKNDCIEIRMSGADDWKKFQVTGIIRNPNSQGVVMLKSTLEEKDIAFVPNTIITKKVVSEQDYENMDFVISVTAKSEMIKNWEKNIEVFDIIILIFITFSVVLVFLVLQNAATLSFNERRKEFATLKVMGVTQKNLKKILRAQNLWLTVVGILIGIPFALPVLRWMFETNGGDVDYIAVIKTGTYLLSAIVTYIISLAINMILSRKVKKIDMVESMKASE